MKTYSRVGGRRRVLETTGQRQSRQGEAESRYSEGREEKWRRMVGETMEREKRDQTWAARENMGTINLTQITCQRHLLLSPRVSPTWTTATRDKPVPPRKGSLLCTYILIVTCHMKSGVEFYTSCRCPKRFGFWKIFEKIRDSQPVMKQTKKYYCNMCSTN